jgi:hypothetical protein
MFSGPFGLQAEALGCMFGANHQVSLVFQTGCHAILNRGFASENCSSNGQAKPDRLLG